MGLKHTHTHVCESVRKQGVQNECHGNPVVCKRVFFWFADCHSWCLERVARFPTNGLQKEYCSFQSQDLSVQKRNRYLQKFDEAAMQKLVRAVHEWRDNKGGCGCLHIDRLSALTCCMPNVLPPPDAQDSITSAKQTTAPKTSAAQKTSAPKLHPPRRRHPRRA